MLDSKNGSMWKHTHSTPARPQPLPRNPQKIFLFTVFAENPFFVDTHAPTKVLHFFLWPTSHKVALPVNPATVAVDVVVVPRLVLLLLRSTYIQLLTDHN